MQIIKSISRTVNNLAVFIENLTNLGNDIVGDEGLKPIVTESLGMATDSIVQSRKMANIEAREEMREFMLKHPLEAKAEKATKK